jgi:hypothetical protein
LLAFASGPAMPQDVPSVAERFYQERFCAGMDVAIRLGWQRRADCINETHAIEVDWHDEWKYGVSQMLAFSAETGLMPGIVLVCRSDQGHCLKSSLLLRQTITHHKIRSTLWDCLPIDESIEDCIRWELNE